LVVRYLSRILSASRGEAEAVKLRAWLSIIWWFLRYPLPRKPMYILKTEFRWYGDVGVYWEEERGQRP
jgi:hypothetical protein